MCVQFIGNVINWSMQRTAPIILSFSTKMPVHWSNFPFWLYTERRATTPSGLRISLPQNGLLWKANVSGLSWFISVFSRRKRLLYSSIQPRERAILDVFTAYLILRNLVPLGKTFFIPICEYGLLRKKKEIKVNSAFFFKLHLWLLIKKQNFTLKIWCQKEKFLIL